MDTIERLRGIDFIIALAFGAPAALPPNQAIALRAEYLSMWGDFLPVITQRDIIIEKRGVPVYYLDDGKSHTSTLKLARKFRGLIVTKRGWKRGLMVAAPPILERAVRDFRRVGFDIQPDDHLVETYSPDYWYRRESGQWWTRSRHIYEAREAVLLNLPCGLYEWSIG